MKRQRGRGPSRPSNQNPNRAYESNGPDMRVRGSAQTVLERYGQAGRDAMAAGDRVLAENYFQHAEHYLRLIKAIQPNFIPRTEMAIAGFPSDYDENADENMPIEAEKENFEGQEPREGQNNRGWNRDENGRNNNRNNNNDRNNDRNNRNRNRDRYRPDRNLENGAIGQENNGQVPSPQNPISNDPVPQNTEIETNSGEVAAAPREPRAPRNSRTRRPPREDQSAGFGDELPAFLAGPAISVDVE